MDLPASLMPPESIFDFAHYKAEFDTIFAALAEAGDKSLQNLSLWCLIGAVLVCLAGVLLGILFLRTEKKQLQKIIKKRS